jgi:hypothetical protein
MATVLHWKENRMAINELQVSNGSDKADLIRPVANPAQHLHVTFDTSIDPMEAHLDVIEEIGVDGVTFGLRGHVASAVTTALAPCFAWMGTRRRSSTLPSQNNLSRKQATMPTKTKNSRKKPFPRKRAVPLRARTSDTRRLPFVAMSMAPPDIAARVMRVYAELPGRLARCRSPFELWVEQWLVGSRLLAALQPPPQVTPPPRAR